MFENNMTTVQPLQFWSQKILPLVYDDSLSYVEVLYKVVAKINEVIDEYGTSGERFAELEQDVAELNAAFEQFKASGFDDYYKEQVEEWIDAHITWIAERYVKMVLFGLDDAGHFVAYIPESWNDIMFDTVTDPASDDYGKLVLEY